MAQAGYQRGGNWRTSCGRLRKFYIRTQASPGGLWTVGASADTEAQLAAAIERVRARYPHEAIRVDTFTKGGERIEGVALDPTPAAAAA